MCGGGGERAGFLKDLSTELRTAPAIALRQTLRPLPQNILRK